MYNSIEVGCQRRLPRTKCPQIQKGMDFSFVDGDFSKILGVPVMHFFGSLCREESTGVAAIEIGGITPIEVALTHLTKFVFVLVLVGLLVTRQFL